MRNSPPATAPQDAQRPALHPLSILRAETALSRFPIHNLTKRGPLTIHIHRTTAQGALDYHWEVSYNTRYGQPGPLAYKLDTLVINQCLDALPRPLPHLIRVGSLRQIGTRLDLNTSGRQQGHLKTAFHQNASAYIVARIRYRSREGTERRLDAGFTRYSVLFTGDPLPDGTPADAVYLVLSAPYREVLTHARVRPLDYAYLQGLTPTAQRFYELLSYQMFATLRRHRPHATLRYTDYCLLAPQPRGLTYEQVKKHMYKVHQPHVASRYLAQVQYEATTDIDGHPDWLMHYVPGPKARAEFVAFTRPAGHAVATTRGATGEDEQEDLVAAERLAILPLPAPPASTLARATSDQPPHPAATPPNTPTLEPLPVSTDPLEAQAQALVAAFYRRFHGRAQSTASPKELAHATQLLTEHSEAAAHFLLTYAHQAAPATAYQLKFFGGILPYLPEALAAYDAQARQAAQACIQQAAAREQRCHERYLSWQHDQCAQLRAALSREALMALEDAQRTRLRAAGTALVALDMAVRVAIDNVLAAQAQLPTYEVWRQQQEEDR